jgi:phenylalanyl-tRNA synthetase beta chain
MKISHTWLKDYIEFRMQPAELAERLSMLGLEVESYEDQSKLYDRFVVGEIIGINKHPHADRLTLCRVNVGKEILNIVCGAPNVGVKQKVAVAHVGAIIPHNQHDPEGKPFVLSRTIIRGVESNGMICSDYELGLGENKDGILILNDDAKVGLPLSAYLRKNDIIYEIEVTANRGDWLSHVGVAREIGALIGKKPALPKISLYESTERTSHYIKISIEDKKKCFRYAGRVIRGVKVQPSPQWMQNRLSSVGIRPINNIVDATNYVLMETGQPLHAFDYDRLSGHSIIVRTAKDGEQITTLDGKRHSLRGEILLICDEKKPVAIAGVMGGINSEIGDSTTTVFIESAHFHPGSIRRTSKYLELSTDASQRFERGVDIDMVGYAADRAAQLTQEIAGGEVLRGIIDVYPRKVKPNHVRLRFDRANQILGTSLTKKRIVSFLRRVGLTPLSYRKKVQDSAVFSVPNFRNDLNEEIDLIEEVARIYGYNNIETKTYAMVDFSSQREQPDFDDEIRHYMMGAGFNEIMTLSLQNKESVLHSDERFVEVLNPVSGEAQCLRTNLIIGALKVVQHNRFQGQLNLRYFEIGAVFARKGEYSIETLNDVNEEQRLLILLSGNNFPNIYGAYSRSVDIFDLKGEVEAFLKKFLLDKYCFISYDSHSPLTEVELGIEINGTYAGFLGKVKRSILEEFEIEGDVFVCELKFSVLYPNFHLHKKFSPLPRYPKVSRDVAFVVDQTLVQERIEKEIRESGGDLLEEVRLFDVYTGEQVGSGKKSLAYSLEFQPKEKTLTDQEIDEMMDAIIRRVEEKLGARLRDM